MDHPYAPERRLEATGAAGSWLAGWVAGWPSGSAGQVADPISDPISDPIVESISDPNVYTNYDLLFYILRFNFRELPIRCPDPIF